MRSALRHFLTLSYRYNAAAIYDVNLSSLNQRLLSPIILVKPGLAIPDSPTKTLTKSGDKAWRIPGLCLSSPSSLFTPLEIFFSVNEQEIGQPSGEKDWRRAHGRRPARDSKGKLSEMLYRPTAPYTLLQSRKGHVPSETCCTILCTCIHTIKNSHFNG